MVSKGALYLGGCLAALSISSVALAQDAGSVVQDTFSAISFSGGIGVISLPEIPTGVFSHGAGNFDTSNSGLGVGAEGKVVLSTRFARSGNFDFFVDGVLSGGIFAVNSSAVDTFTGPGYVVIQSYSPGSAVFDLDTTNNGVNASATSDVTSNGQNANENMPAAVGNDAADSITPIPAAPGGFIYSGVSILANGAGAAAFGAVADPNGFSFLGVGDLDGLTITTDVSETAFLASGEIYLGVTGAANNSSNTSMQAYFGPSARHIGRNIDTSIGIDIAEVPGQPVDFQMLGLNRNEELNGDYLGGLVGVGASHLDEQSGIVYSAGVEAGLYAYRFNFSGSESFVIGPNTVNSNTTVSETANGAAWMARGQVAVSMPVSRQSQLTIAGTTEYLSRAPSIARMENPTPTITEAGNAHNADYTTVAGAVTNSRISVGDMWNFGLSATWSNAF